VIGGASGNPATVTIAASDPSGNPLAGGASMSSSLGTSDQPFSGTVGSSTTLSGASNQLSASGVGGALATGVTQIGDSPAVPEPSTLLLIALGALGCLGARY
jgi:hypothetical protein